MKIGIVLGSIRKGRFGKAVANWVLEQAEARGQSDVSYELIDLAEFNVPPLSAATVPGAANKQYEDPNVQAWSAAIDACDGFVFVTAEYNHGVPGVFKNAYDCLGNEWLRKPVAFVSYGAIGGHRAVEQWRQIVSNFQQYDIRSQVAFSTFTEVTDGVFTPDDRRPQELSTMLDDLIAGVGRFTA